MTENEFLKEYEKRFLEIVYNKATTLKSYSSLHYNHLHNKYVDLGAEINYQGNILIAILMDEFRINFSAYIQENGYSIPIGSYLLRKSFSIQLEKNKHFEEVAKIVLSEALNQDYPEHQS